MPQPSDAPHGLGSRAYQRCPIDHEGAVGITGRRLAHVVALLAGRHVDDAVAAHRRRAVDVARRRLTTVVADLSGGHVERAVAAHRGGAIVLPKGWPWTHGTSDAWKSRPEAEGKPPEIR
jgi:hypothetical protein